MAEIIYPGLMAGLLNSVDRNVTDIVHHADSVLHNDIYKLNQD